VIRRPPRPTHSFATKIKSETQRLFHAFALQGVFICRDEAASGISANLPRSNTDAMATEFPYTDPQGSLPLETCPPALTPAPRLELPMASEAQRPTKVITGPDGSCRHQLLSTKGPGPPPIPTNSQNIGNRELTARQALFPACVFNRRYGSRFTTPPPGMSPARRGESSMNAAQIRCSFPAACRSMFQCQGGNPFTHSLHPS